MLIHTYRGRGPTSGLAGGLLQAMGLSVTGLHEVLLSNTSPSPSPTKASPFSISLHALQKKQKDAFRRTGHQRISHARTS